jgi:hypothetical protein
MGIERHFDDESEFLKAFEKGIRIRTQQQEPPLPLEGTSDTPTLY